MGFISVVRLYWLLYLSGEVGVWFVKKAVYNRVLPFAHGRHVG